MSSLLREFLGLFSVELALVDSFGVVDSLESPVLEVDVCTHLSKLSTFGDILAFWNAPHLIQVEDGNLGAILHGSMDNIHVWEPVAFTIESEEPGPSTGNFNLEHFTVVELVMVLGEFSSMIVKTLT